MRPLATALAALPTDDCVLWSGHIDTFGYGKSRRTSAHRNVYRRLVGPIPAGMQLDHVCHSRDAACVDGDSCLHRRCVNPSHLEVVTPLENARRARPAGQTRCVNGHAYDALNTYIRPNGQRDCRPCVAARQRRYVAGKLGAA